MEASISNAKMCVVAILTSYNEFVEARYDYSYSILFKLLELYGYTQKYHVISNKIGGLGVIFVITYQIHNWSQ